MKEFLVCLLIHLFLLCAAPAFFAQDTVTGAFEGTVTNSQTGDPIVGATAEIINIETGIIITKTTDSRGRFYQGLLNPGLYRIRVSFQGYQTREVIQRLNVARTGEVVPVPVTLEPATAIATPAPQPTQPTAPAPPTTPPPTTTSQQVSTVPPAIAAAVSEIRASINTTDGQRSGSFNESVINLLPLGGVTLTRTFDELALLLPGVAPAPPTLGVAAGPGQGPGVGTSGQFAVNGLRSRGNNFTVDGSDNNDEDIGVRRQGFTALVPQTIESVREYQAITLLAPAQFGRNIGGNVNAVSKSGGSGVHGNLYGFLNTSQLNARNFFDTTNGTDTTPLRGAGNQRVLLRQLVNGAVVDTPITVTNQSGGEDSFTLGKVGAVLGGPITPQKTFYFFSFERQIINASQEESFVVPTLEQRGVQNSGATGLATDPFTGRAVLARPVGANAPIIFSLFPYPNNPLGTFGRNTFTQSRPASARGTVFSAKLDHNFKLNERTQSATGRYNFTNDWREIPVTGGALFSTLRPRVRAQNFSFFFNSQVSAPNARTEKFNQVRLSYGRTRLRFEEVRDTQFLRPSSTAFLLNASVFVNRTVPVGDPNTRDVIFTRDRDEFESIFPLGQVYVAGFSPIGVDVFNFPQRRVNNTYQLADIFTLRRGNHNFAFGADTRRSELNSELPRVSRPLVVYNGGPRLVANADNTVSLPGANDRTPFLRPEDLVALDAPSAFFLTLDTLGLGANINLRYYQLDFFAQDDWKLRHDLSLALGLRYEYNTPPHEVNDLIERTFNDPALNQVPALRNFIEGRREIFDPDLNNFAPRLGLAYAPSLFGRDRLTVFRAGYGIFYDQALGAVVSQSRNVFPTFVPLNFGGLRAFNNNQQITFINPARFVIGNQPVVKEGTINVLNPALGLPALINYLNGTTAAGGQPFPDALGLTLPTRKLDTPMAHHYSVAAEQQLNANLTVSAAYVGTLGRNLLRFITPNQGPGAVVATTGLVPGGTPALNGRIVTPRRPSSGVGAVYLFTTTAESRYDSLQLELRGRWQRGLQFNLAYTWSHAIDDVSDVFELAGDFGLPQNSATFAGERASANFDLRHRLASYFVYDFSALSRSRLLDGLQLAGTGQFNTGPPFTVNSLFDINLDGNLTDRLNTTSGLVSTGKGRRPLQLQTENPFSLLASPGQDGRVGRNTFRADGLALVDLAVIKQFKFGAQQRLGLRAEFFNLFNHANFGIPVRLLEAPGFGLATRTVTPARRIQFALKYEF
jgi:hypothetical protein